MKITDNEAQDLRDSLVAKATRHLNGGAQARRDYGSWAESLAHDSIVELLEYEGTGNVFKLGATICERRCRDFKRDEINRREIESEHGKSINKTLTGQSAEMLAADPLDTLLKDEMALRFDNLSPMLKQTLEQYYMEGKTAEELAVIQLTSVATIYKRLQRARDIIKDEDEGDRVRSDRMSDEQNRNEARTQLKERAARIDARMRRQREQVALQERGMEWTLPNSRRLQLEGIT